MTSYLAVQTLKWQSLRANQRVCFHSVEATLKAMFERPGFAKKITHRKKRCTNPDVLYNVYDGRMWHELMDQNNKRSVDDDDLLPLTLNVDWFQPFSTGRIHSAGAVYLTINNLPHSEQYKPWNVILVGIMQSPKEPSMHRINHYLRPVVDELEKFYTGVIATVNGRSNTRIRAALLMVACDIRAARKVSGFTGIASMLACYKCKRQFSSIAGNHLQRDFSGFTTEEIAAWEKRSGTENRIHAEAWANASNLDERRMIERVYGAGSSELRRLTYFDAVRCTIVDPMHKLYSGTAKGVLDLWSRCSIRVRTRLRSPHKTLKLWSLEGNYLLSMPSISLKDLDDAHEYLRQFCEQYDRLYGKEEITLNMHLKKTIEDFGPIYALLLNRLNQPFEPASNPHISFRRSSRINELALVWPYPTHQDANVQTILGRLRTFCASSFILDGL
ncbi:hypothetical protein VTP01DRAFT_7272 [Rhizomucor pusillus]|uniref:uncharacterized protein n=1 Tax=Rhizomucor pusillus TaxID=4840 RepID=UPI003741F419